MNKTKLETSLHDAQTVKQELQQKLNEKKTQRQKLETELHAITSKVAQTKDLHAKMSEVCKLAQHKVNQSQAQTDSLEMNNSQKRAQLQELSDQSDEEDNLREKYIHKVKEEICEMTAMFITACKVIYKPCHLKEKTAAIKKQCEQREMDVSNLEELRETERFLNKLNAETTAVQDWNIDRQEAVDTFRQYHDEVLSRARILYEQSRTPCQEAVA